MGSRVHNASLTAYYLFAIKSFCQLIVLCATLHKSSLRELLMWPGIGKPYKERKSGAWYAEEYKAA